MCLAKKDRLTSENREYPGGPVKVAPRASAEEGEVLFDFF